MENVQVNENGLLATLKAFYNKFLDISVVSPTAKRLNVLYQTTDEELSKDGSSRAQAVKNAIKMNWV